MLSRVLKKSICFLCAICLAYALLFTFYGCGHTSDNTDGWGVGDIASRIPVSIYFPGSPGKDMDRVLEEIEKESAPLLNIELKFNWIEASEYEGAIASKLASAQNFDAFYYSEVYDLGESGSALTLLELVNNNLVYNINGLFQQYAPGIYGSLSEEEMKAITFDNKIVAIPWRFPVSSRKSAAVRDDLNALYIEGGVADFEDLEVFADKITGSKINIVPIGLFTGTLELFAPHMGFTVFDERLGLVYRENDPGMQLMLWEETPEYRDVLLRLLSWYKKGYIPSEFENKDEAGFFYGKYACFIDEIYQALFMNTRIKAGIDTEFKYKIYSLYPEYKMPKKSLLENAILINKNSSKPESVLMFLEWVHSSQKNHDLLMYGIEGEHYTIYGEQYVLPPQVNIENHPYMGWGGSEAFLNINFIRTSVYNDPFSKQLLTDETRSEYAPHHGIHPVLRDFEAIKRRTDNFQKLNKPSLSMLDNPDNIERFIAENSDYSFHKTVEELQRQLNEWFIRK